MSNSLCSITMTRGAILCEIKAIKNIELMTLDIEADKIYFLVSVLKDLVESKTFYFNPI